MEEPQQKPYEPPTVTDYGDLKMQIVDYQPGNGQRLGASSN